MNTSVIARATCSIYDFDFLLQDFIKKLTIKGVSQKTIEAYTRNIAQIALFFNTNPLQLCEKQLEQYLYQLKSTRLGPTAFRHAIYALRSLFTLNGKKSLKNKLPRIVLPLRVPVVLSLAECKRLI